MSIFKEETSAKALQELLEQEINYAQLLIDNKGTIQAWNQGATELLGYAKTAMLGKNLNFIYPTDSKNELEYNLSVASKKGRCQHNTWRVLKNGRLLFVNEAFSSLKKDGKIQGYSVIYRDIGESKIHEEALVKIGSVGKIGYWQYDVQEEKIFWSETTREIHEIDDPDYNPSLEDGINFYDGKKNRESMQENFRRAIQNHTPYIQESKIITAKGNKKWILATGYPVVLEGQCLLVYGSFQDIDEQKKQQKALEDSQRKFKRIFKSSAIAMAVIHESGELLESNKVFRQLFRVDNRSPELTIDQLFHKDVPESINKKYQNLYK